MESGDEPRSNDSWNDRRPQPEERHPLNLAGRSGPRETERGAEGEADHPPPPFNRYQPPRARHAESEAPPARSYEAPRGGSRGDAYEPPRGAPRGGDAYEPPRGSGYNPPGRPAQRYSGGGFSDAPPARRPLVGGRPAEDRWGASGGGGFDRDRNRDEERPETWRRGSSNDAPARQPSEQPV